jgi:pyruvate dehydrogenase E2 component (dihydrolipoamide acetyltransferase)
MPIVSIRIPQIGEGLQEARLVAVLKAPGERIRRDEPIYQMETDKAVMDVESPYEGTLIRWLAEPDDVLEIGSELAEIDVEGAKPTESVRPVSIAPRTRAYAREKGLSDEALAGVAATGSKLMPEDIDRHLGQQSAPKAKTVGQFVERPLSQKQRLLASRMVRSSQSVVPGTITMVVKWGEIEALRTRHKARGDGFMPSAFTIFAYAVVSTTREFPAFRSSLVGDSTLRAFDHTTLGIAVGLPQDELALAVVEDADALPWREFAATMRDRIDLARTGKDQASDAVTLSLTNMQSFGIRDAIPVVVAPSVATIFLGEIYYGQDPKSDQPKLERVCNIALTFDHRLINGVGAAKFLSEVKRRIEAIGTILE